MTRKKTLAAMVAAAFVGAGTAAGILGTPSWAAKAPEAQVAPAAVAAAPGALPDYRTIVQNYGPAVVGVTVDGRKATANSRGMPEMPDNPLFEFFRGMPNMPQAPRGGMPMRGQGSGFIVSADGLILTNAHVVRDASEVTVRLSDRREFTAKVLGADPTTDVAVLKIDATGLPTVAIGDPKQVQVGDPVLAIGSPFGFEQSATQGIVSAKGRSLPGDSYVPFIQTDAAVNPGNSGGPLFDGSGRVVGINSQIYSQSGGFQGLAFAIPIDVALKVKDQIVTHGTVRHARLGVTLQDLNQPLAESFGLKTPQGALISSVMPGSAAKGADLQPGDVITQIDGQPVRAAGDVSSRVGMAVPGDKIRLSVWRDKSSRDIEVKLGEAQKETAQKAEAAPVEPGSLGLAVRPLSEAERKEAQVDQGLLVERAGGPAARAGIEPGDVLLALNGKPVKDAEQIRKALADKPKHVALLIQRDGRQIFVPVNLG
jgi:serine protease Do